MKSRLNPYINLKGNTKEAMEFYQTIFGGKLDMDTYEKFPMPGMDENENDKIMHAMLEAELKGYFEKLSEGGTVMSPLESAPWGDSFGIFQVDVEAS